MPLPCRAGDALRWLTLLCLVALGTEARARSVPGPVDLIPRRGTTTRSGTPKGGLGTRVSTVQRWRAFFVDFFRGFFQAPGTALPLLARAHPSQESGLTAFKPTTPRRAPTVLWGKQTRHTAAPKWWCGLVRAAVAASWSGSPGLATGLNASARSQPHTDRSVWARAPSRDAVYPSVRSAKWWQALARQLDIPALIPSVRRCSLARVLGAPASRCPVGSPASVGRPHAVGVPVGAPRSSSARRLGVSVRIVAFVL